MFTRVGAWARAARRSIRSVGDLRSATRMLLGAWDVRRHKHRLPITALVRRYVGQSSGLAASPTEPLIDLAWLICRASRGGGHGNCLERSLVLFRSLGEAGYRPELWFGVRAAEGGTDGHVWVVIDGVAAGDDPAMLRDYVPLMVFGADGLLTRGSDAAAPPSISWACTSAVRRLAGWASNRSQVPDSATWPPSST